jgi:hypothetical protein
MSPQKRVWLVVGIVAILALVGAFHYYKRSQQVVTPTEAVTSIVYSNVADGVTFSYPSTYALETHELDIEGMKGKYLTLTPADIELPDAGEGPPGITIEIFENKKRISLEKWLESNTHGTSALASHWKPDEQVVGGEKGITYTASGLYESDNIAVSHGEKIYVFSASWATRDDQTLKDLQSVLTSVQFIK